MVAVLVVVMVAGGLWWWLRPTPVDDGVVFVGDSVTVLSLGDLNADLGSKHPAYIARVGFRSDQLLPLFAKVVDERRQDDGGDLRQVALLVGYNDVLQEDVEGPALGEVMALAARFDCAVWLELPTVPMHELATARWNERAVATAAKYPNVHLVDTWRRAAISAKPGTLLRSDGVHPNARGQATLTRIYVDAIGRAC